MSDNLTPQGATSVRLAMRTVQLLRERDRAREIAVALEQRLAGVEAALSATTDEGVSCGGLTVDAPGCYAGDLALRIRAAMGADQ